MQQKEMKCSEGEKYYASVCDAGKDNIYYGGWQKDEAILAKPRTDNAWMEDLRVVMMHYFQSVISL